MIKLGIYNKDDEAVYEVFSAESELQPRKMYMAHENEVHLGARTLGYEKGDYIKVEVEQPNTYLWIKLDDTFEESLVYFKDTTEFIYKVPFGDEKRAMKDTAFAGVGRYLSARVPSVEDIYKYQNLTKNRHATYEDVGVYPFAHANTETRNDPTFFARNAIDGIYANDDHGFYPFQSWGINQQDDAAITIEFGREVIVDKAAITIRADFPHDTWWKEVTLEFSDGTEELLNTKKVSEVQEFNIKERKIEWVKMKNLIKGEPGPFPALTQLELFGKNIKEEK